MASIDAVCIKNLKCYNKMKESSVKSQLDYYIENNSPPEILDYVKLSNKAFGTEIEKITKEIFNLKKSKTSSCDLVFNKYRIEVKGSRLWSGKTFKWQHIMEEHEFDSIIFCAIDYNELRFWIILKVKFLELKANKVVTQQGGGEGQGLWCEYEKIKKYLTPIYCENDIRKFYELLDVKISSENKN